MAGIGVRTGSVVAALLVVAGAVAGPAPASDERLPHAGGPPRPAQETTADLIQRSVRLRLRHGLRADVPFVQRLVVSGEPRGRELFSIPLTQDEEREMRVRLGVSRRLPALERRARRLWPKSFAGLYLDQRAGGLVRIGFTRDVAARVRRLRSNFAYDERLRGFLARHSLAKLRRVHRRVSSDRAALRRRGIEVAGIADRIPRNRVEIGVDGVSPGVRTFLRDRYGRATSVVRADARRREEDRYDTIPPWRAGLEIYSTYVCTMGFISRDEVVIGYTQYFVMTAGHCGPNNSEWYHGGAYVGQMVRNDYRDGSVADSAAIEIPAIDANNHLFVNANEPARDVTSIQSEHDDNVGDFVCSSGRTTLLECGNINDTNFEVTYDDGRTFREQRLSSALTDSGDSGAPQFVGGEAYGILSGGYVTYNSDGTVRSDETIYSHVGNVIDETVVFPLTEPGPGEDVVLG